MEPINKRASYLFIHPFRTVSSLKFENNSPSPMDTFFGKRIKKSKIKSKSKNKRKGKSKK